MFRYTHASRVWDGRVWDGRVWDGRVWDGRVWDGRVWDGRVWDAFGCETMADYHDIYLQLDVLLLSDFFETFRKTCLEFSSLDSIHYYTTSGLSWDAAFRMSLVDLQLITDNDMCSWRNLYDLYSSCPSQ